MNLLQHAGFTLAEIAQLIGPAHPPDRPWRAAIRAKLAELEQAQAAINQARTILQHALACPHASIAACPVFLREVHAQPQRMERGEPERQTPRSAGISFMDRARCVSRPVAFSLTST